MLNIATSALVILILVIAVGLLTIPPAAPDIVEAVATTEPAGPPLPFTLAAIALPGIPAPPIAAVATFTPPHPLPAVALTVSPGELADAVVAYFPEDAAHAYRVFMCESGGDPTIVSPDGQEGVAQNDPGSNGPTPAGVWAQVAQARQTFEAALATWVDGWRPWPVCRYS